MPLIKIVLIVWLIVMAVASINLCARINLPHPREQKPATVQEDTIAAVVAVATTLLFGWFIFGHPAI